MSGSEEMLLELFHLASKETRAAYYIIDNYIEEKSIDFELLFNYFYTKSSAISGCLLRMIDKINPETIPYTEAYCIVFNSKNGFISNYFAELLVKNFAERLSNTDNKKFRELIKNLRDTKNTEIIKLSENQMIEVDCFAKTFNLSYKNTKLSFA